MKNNNSAVGAINQPAIPDYISILKQYWGYDSFRGIQREIIESIGAGRDTLGLMPTGGGKSLTFQVPAMAKEGVCIVLTPLIALMKDQVAHLREVGIPAAAIHTGMRRDDIISVLEKCVFGKLKLLYVSPERLASDIFIAKLRHIDVSFICVDEAHCISQWGYDFRPAYLQIAKLRKQKPDAPVLALTATATPAVVDDIQDKLAFREKNVFRMSFRRDNLAYVVRRTDDKEGEMLHILQSVEGSAIVYVRSRRRTKEIADLLSDNGITATFYHAGLDNFIKDVRQKEWQQDAKRVMVATNAFGMGIDKPDVRLVVHVDCPDSIEAYFQEAGRAGRDGGKAYAVLLWNRNDITKMRRRVADNFPEKEYIRKVYDCLAYFFEVGVGGGYGAVFEFDIERFCYAYKFFPVPVQSALRLLQMAGYIGYNEEADAQARVMFLLDRDELYRLKKLSPTEDRVIEALLRGYGGLFSDYQYINENYVADRAGAGISAQDVYQCLKHLDEEEIVRFIPCKNIPRIRYAQRREESEHIVIGQDIYDERKRNYIERISAMESYLADSARCRSVALLSYFGEGGAEACGVCDVCLDHRDATVNEGTIAEASRAIRQLLADGESHPIGCLRSLPMPATVVDAALDRMVGEGDIRHDCVRVRLARH